MLFQKGSDHNRRPNTQNTRLELTARLKARIDALELKLLDPKLKVSEILALTKLQLAVAKLLEKVQLDWDKRKPRDSYARRGVLKKQREEAENQGLI